MFYLLSALEFDIYEPTGVNERKRIDVRKALILSDFIRYPWEISNRLIFAFEAKQRKYISFKIPFFSQILIAVIHTD